MINTEQILNYKVSFQKNAYSNLTHELKISDVFRGIKEERLINQITTLRRYLKNGERSLYDSEKKNLPGVTFCATFFQNRRKENINHYNQLIVIDIDKLDNSQIEDIKSKLWEDKYVFAYWVSPSNSGLKGLLKLDFQFEIDTNQVDYVHKSAFTKIVSYFENKYKIVLDESGKDTTRLCFLSSDNQIVIKDVLLPFEIYKEDLIQLRVSNTSPRISKPKDVLNAKDTLFNPKDRNSALNRKAFRSIYTFLKKRNISITSTYDNWYKVALAIARSFTYDIGEEYFLKLCRLDGANHNEDKSKDLLKGCYINSKGDITFNTIFFLAKEKGYKSHRESSSEGG